jgi:hypothetical protein
VSEIKSAPRINPPNSQWEQNLPLRNSQASGKADAWDELNQLGETYLEFSMTSNILRGLMLITGLIPLGFGIFLLGELGFDQVAGSEDGFWSLAFLLSACLLSLSVFVIRLDLRLPKDRPVRFNRRQGKVYANYYTWNHNPFGRWGGGAKVFDWNTLQAEITKQIGASGTVVTQRYSLDLVVCKPGTSEEVDRFRLQQGAQTIKQYEEQWEFIRRYMEHGLEGLPPQKLRNQTPGFVDCLLFAMPWFAPTESGKRARERMRGFWGTLMASLLSVLFPLWLLFGLGNFVVMRLAPQASWPPELDEQSRR